MKNIDIIVMGKTGAGKSTLINAVLGEDLAPTGTGQAVTNQNKVYTKKMMLPIGKYGDVLGCQVNMCDTVGLEIDSCITDHTLVEIKERIIATKSKMSADDLHLVWFCVNDRSSRFETYELELIRKLSIDYEIPFVIILTQCFSDTAGELEVKISRTIPEVPCKRVLAKDYKTRGGVISAYGISELLTKSAKDYGCLKLNILEKKLNVLDEQRKERIAKIESAGKMLIKQYGESGKAVGYVPGGCIPWVHGICIKLIVELNKLAGFKLSKEFAAEIFTSVIVGIAATPLMMVPFLSRRIALNYVQLIGEDYLKAMLNIIEQSTDRELQDNAFMKERIKQELKNFKTRR